MAEDAHLPPEPVEVNRIAPGPGPAEVDPVAPGPGPALAGSTGQQGEPDPLPGTGHPAVDAVLAELVRVEHSDPAEQLPAFQAVHRTLRETLASIDQT